MINIIPTLTVMKTHEEYENMIENFISSNSYIFRCNATRFDNDTYINSIGILQKIYFEKKHDFFELMLDIPCPKEKIRIEFLSDKNDICIKKDELINITNNKDKYNNNFFYVNVSFYQIEVGEKIILGDGDITLKVISKSIDVLTCISMNSGTLGYRKAFYTSKIFCKNTNEKTMIDCIKLIETLKPDYIALSFIESVEEIIYFKSLIDKILNYEPIIILKIETRQAIDNLKNLANVSPNIMIARGDLALTAGYEMLYKNQKDIIEICNGINNCNLYFASEIINSLVNSSIPTRPEICDLANMMNMGAENIVLSGPLCRYNNYNLAVKYIHKLYEIYHIK